MKPASDFMMRLLRSASARVASRLGLTVVSLLAVFACVACGASSSSSLASSSADAGTTSTAQANSSGATTGTSTTVLPGTGRPQVTLGDKNYTEQFLLGELYTLALQAQGYTVALNQNIGPTAVTLGALGTGALDMYPEYLNVFNSSVAGNHRAFPTQLAAYGAAQR